MLIARKIALELDNVQATYFARAECPNNTMLRHALIEGRYL
jgi:hypothetical protein